MKLKDILNRGTRLLPLIGLAIGYENWKMAKEAKIARIEETIETKRQLYEKIKESQEITISNKVEQQCVEDLTNKIREELVNAKTSYNKMAECIEKIIKAKENVANTNSTTTTNPAEDIQNTEVLEVYKDLYRNSMNKIDKNLQDILEIVNSKDTKLYSDLINQVNEIIERYKDFLSTLSFEQITSLMNLLALIVVLFSVFSIAAIFYGEYLIKHLNLENKYPKIKKFIYLRRKFQWYYFNFDFICLIIALSFLICFNLYCLVNPII